MYIVNDNSKANYGEGNEITYNTEVLKSNLCDYNDAYILATCYITITAGSQIQVVFKKCVRFTKCITRIDGTTIDNVENLDLAMSMSNLIEYSSDYSES